MKQTFLIVLIFLLTCAIFALLYRFLAALWMQAIAERVRRIREDRAAAAAAAAAGTGVEADPETGTGGGEGAGAEAPVIEAVVLENAP